MDKYMNKHLEELIEVVENIIEAGWHPSSRKGSTGIGKTFEDLLGKEEDNHDLPDFHDIEIKTRDKASNSMITLFTKSPSYPKGANTFLRNNFGVKDEFGNNILHMTVSGVNKTNSEKYAYDFKVEVDRKNEKLNLIVYNKNGEIVSDNVFWSFVDLKKQIDKKLKFIVIISGEVKKLENGQRAYKYNEIDLVTGLSVEKLLEAIESGDLKVDIRIGAYKSGKNKGKTHDHGTGFRINMLKLVEYANVEKIK